MRCVCGHHKYAPAASINFTGGRVDRGGNISNTIGGGCSAATALWSKHTCRSQTGYHHYHYTIQQIQRQCLYGYQSVASVVKSYVSSLVCAYNHRMCHSLQQSQVSCSRREVVRKRNTVLQLMFLFSARTTVGGQLTEPSSQHF